MKRSIKLFALILGCSAIAACESPTGPESELAEAKRRWADTRLTSYEITVQVACFCPNELTRPVVVAVQYGTVESKRYLDSGAPVTQQYSYNFLAVDGLFAVVDAALARRAARIDVTYDAARGFPTRIDIDNVAQAADDEISYTARDLRLR